MATHVIPALLCLLTTFIAMLKINLPFYHFIYISAKITEMFIEIDVLWQNITAIEFQTVINLDAPVMQNMAYLT